MTSVTRQNFGFLIAYVIPGFTVIVALSARSPTLRQWLGLGITTSPTVGGFLYVTVASMAAGMTLGALRWLILDRIHHHTGIRPPIRNFAAVHDARETFEYFVEMHYRYYEFYGHMLLATLFVFANSGTISTLLTVSSGSVRIFLVGAASLFFVASRDALKNYYHRTAAVLDKERRRYQQPQPK